MEYIPINLKLISHPLNWLIVILVVMLVGFGMAAIFPKGG